MYSILVGDGAVGKTSMIISYINNGYPNKYRQTAFDVFSGKSALAGHNDRLHIEDKQIGLTGLK